MKVAVFEQIKKSLQRVKVHTISKISELSSTTVDALEEMNTKKADKPQYINVTIPASNWESDSFIYPKYYDITIEGVTANDRADIIILPKSMKTVADCGFCAVSETFVGGVRVRALKQPTETISAEIILKR